MTGWAWFWCATIIVAIISYFGLAVVISIGGFFDVRKMFHRLDEEHRSTTSGPPSSPAAP